MTRLGIDAMLGAGDGSTFLGLPAAVPGSADVQVAILGADTATPYGTAGPYCAGGAAAIRRAIAPYANSLTHHDFDLGGPVVPAGVRAVDCGDVTPTRAGVREACEAVLAGGGVPILLGGDDSVPLPLIEALAARGPLAILQIDAHIDWRDEVGGERFGLSSTMRRASELPGVGSIVQVGQRLSATSMRRWRFPPRSRTKSVRALSSVGPAWFCFEKPVPSMSI